MARFYFNLHECGTVTEDDEGVERPDLDAVRQSALAAAREMMCAEVGQGRLCLSCSIEVIDESGACVLTLPFKDAVTVTGV